MNQVSGDPFCSRRPSTGRGEPLLDDEPRTLADIFLRSVTHYDLPDALNYKCRGEWTAISSREMARTAEEVALGLYSIGLRKGDRVAMLAPNSPNWTLIDAGCQFAGIIDVPIYTTVAPGTVRYILENSGARVLFLQDAAELERLASSLAYCEDLEHIYLFAGPAVPGARLLSELRTAGELLRRHQPKLADELRGEVEPEDIATLIYTSGTTGEPKGVMLTHTNIISNAVDASAKYAFSGQDTSLSVLPLSHVFERTGMYVYVMYGMRVFYAESIDKVPDNLKEVHPTIFIGVPRIFEKVFERARLRAAQAGRVNEIIFDWAIEVAKEYAQCIAAGQDVSTTLYAKHRIADRVVYSKLREFFGGHLRFCITGGAALSDEIFLIFTGAGISIMQGYGLTETSPVISSNNPDGVRVGTVGRPIHNVHVRIALDGEIEVKGPGVMAGYFGNAAATDDAFTEDGYFKTGDIGDIDSDGFLCITDRKKELFKTSGGKYIAPAHIEQMIAASRFINQVVLIGSERKFPAALIVPNFEMLESYARQKDLVIDSRKDYCEHIRIIDLIKRQIDQHTGTLAQYEKVKKFALLTDELTVDGGELTPTLKVKRRIVEEKYCDVINGLYAEKDAAVLERV
ncbi:MAG: long-chain fatty acid--CoA ligase [Acidobacteria bacterium]|nr:long-chain fatty acid--CoA ligase [Acidobacteriota bacterium]